ncbi:MAG: peptidase U32 family protein [Bacteroides sp.]
MQKKEIELLAPAKNLACGIAAIDHGADAVYIGAPQLGARVAASNSLEDIAQLVDYAHFYGVRIYVTVNTIIKDEELAEVEHMIWDLYQLGVDALIIQDMGILELNLPPIALHASTQCDNRSVEKVQFLERVGFNQIVLARELSLNEIRHIHESCPKLKLEVFVHGALCVSYSGQCYVSEARSGRSANRGACSQFCRLPFTLKDAEGKLIGRDKHFLSMKDLNQSAYLEELLDAGATSLKIEGRLKDISYVKNVTAAYRQKLDRIIARRPEFVRASSGKINLAFKPQLEKTFSRGFSNYFLKGRGQEIASLDTPKSLGEEMGYVKEIRRTYFTVAGVKPFHNGDGACFLDEQGRLQGFRINRVDTNRIYPLEMPNIKPKTVLYRNYDHEFEKELAKESAERLIEISIDFSETDSGFLLSCTDEDAYSVELAFDAEKELAKRPQFENIRKQLQKLGNTPFYCNKVNIQLAEEWFVPSSILAAKRRELVALLVEKRKQAYVREKFSLAPSTHPYLEHELTYLGNVSNHKAELFYKRHGVRQIAPAFECEAVEGGVLMFCKHCIRYTLGWCPTYQQKNSNYKEPFYLVDAEGEEYRLKFDCKRCQMLVMGSSK